MNNKTILFLICTLFFYEAYALTLKESTYDTKTMGFDGKSVATKGFMLSLSCSNNISYNLRFAPVHIQLSGNYYYEFLQKNNLLIIVRDGGLPTLYVYKFDSSSPMIDISAKSIIQHYPELIIREKFTLKNGSNNKISAISSWLIDDVLFIYLKNTNKNDGSLLIANLVSGSIICKPVDSTNLTSDNDYLMPARIFFPYCPENICRVLAPPMRGVTISKGINEAIFQNDIKIAGESFWGSLFYRYRNAPFYSDSPQFDSVAKSFLRKIALINIADEKIISDSNSSALFKDRLKLPNDFFDKINKFVMDVTNHNLESNIEQWQNSEYIKELSIISNLYKLWQDEYQNNIIRISPSIGTISIAGVDKNNVEEILTAINNDISAPFPQNANILIDIYVDSDYNVNENLPVKNNKNTVSFDPGNDIINMRLMFPNDNLFFDKISFDNKTNQSINQMADKLKLRIERDVTFDNNTNNETGLSDKPSPEEKERRKAEFLAKQPKDNIFTEEEFKALFPQIDYEKITNLYDRGMAYDWNEKFVDAMKCFEQDSSLKSKFMLAMYYKTGRPEITKDIAKADSIMSSAK